MLRRRSPTPRQVSLAEFDSRNHQKLVAKLNNRRQAKYLDRLANAADRADPVTKTLRYRVGMFFFEGLGLLFAITLVVGAAWLGSHIKLGQLIASLSR